MRTSLAAVVAVAMAVVLVSGCGSSTDHGTTPAGQGPTSSSPGAETRNCPHTRPTPDGNEVAIDFIDFVYAHGHTYLRDFGHARGSSAVGPRVGRVTCTISRLVADYRHEIHGPYRDGNAAFLPVGTLLHAVRGYPATCRLAVVQGGHVVEYVAQQRGGRHSVPRTCALHPRDS